MKLLTEPSRIKNILELATYYKSGADITEVPVTFAEDGLTIAVANGNHGAFQAKFRPEFFPDYKGEGELVSFCETLLKRLGWGFTEDKLELGLNGDKIFIKDANDYYDEKLVNLEVPDIPIPCKMQDHGFLPDDTHHVIMSFAAEDLSLRKTPSDEYTIEATKEGLKVIISDENSKFEHNVKAKKVVETSELSLRLPGDTLQRMLTNISGDLWIVMDKGGLCVSQFDDNFYLTYLLLARE